MLSCFMHGWMDKWILIHSFICSFSLMRYFGFDVGKTRPSETIDTAIIAACVNINQLLGLPGLIG